MLLGKRSNLPAADSDGTDGSIFTHKWDGQPRSHTQFLDIAPDVGMFFFALRQHVVNMYRLTVQYGAAAIGTAAQRARLAYSKAGRQISIDRHFPHYVTLDSINLSID